jgi:hypothetical protein
MKTNLHSIYLLLMVLTPALTAAQGNFNLNVNYTPALPTGNFKNVTDAITWRGWEASLLYQATAKFSFGLTGGTLAFYKKNPRAVIHQNGKDISAVVTNSVELMPIMLKVKYDFTGGSLRPFVAVAAGLNVIHYDKYYGVFVDENHVTHFVAQPEVGLHIAFGRTSKVGLNLGVGYNIMPFKNDDTDELNNIVFKAGLGFKLD